MNGVVLGELSQDSQDLFITIHYTAIETYQNDVRLESRTPRMARDHVALFCSSSERRAKRRRDSSGNTAVWIRRRFWCVWLRCIVGIVMQVHSCIWRAGRFHLNLNTHVGSVSRQRRAIMRVIMMTKKKNTTLSCLEITAIEKKRRVMSVCTSHSFVWCFCLFIDAKQHTAVPLQGVNTQDKGCKYFIHTHTQCAIVRSAAQSPSVLVCHCYAFKKQTKKKHKGPQIQKSVTFDL